MITAVLFVPAAPWLIPSVAPTLLAEQQILRDSIGALIDAADVPRWASLGVAGSRSRSRWDRDLPLDLGRDPFRGGSASSTGLPGSHWVARALLGDVPLDAGVLTPPDAGTVPPEQERADRASVTGMLTALEADVDGRALLITADGSTAHGEHAPGAPDERAAGYDADLHAALVHGPAAAQRWLTAPGGTVELAAALGATLPTALRAVLDVLPGVGDPWDVTALDLVMPYGVGHHVALWKRR